MRFDPQTHRLRGWIINFPSQVPRRLLEYLELEICVTNTICTDPLQESLCISVAASQTLKARVISKAQDVTARSTSFGSA